MKLKTVVASTLALALAVALCATTYFGTISTHYTVATPSAPTTALPAVTTPAFTDGSHLVKFAYVTANGIGTLSAAGTTRTTDSTHTAITVSVVASTNPDVTGVKIYATKAGETTPFYLVKDSVANTTADVNVGALDAALTSPAPTADTCQVDSTISLGYYRRGNLWLHNNDSSVPVYISLDGTPVDTSTDYLLNAGADLKLDNVYWQANHIHARSTTAAVSLSYVFTNN